MEQNIPYYKILASRKVEVTRKNLVSVCGLSIKSLIDKACFSSVDDGSEELINFTADLEQILLHQIRPQKNWYGGSENLHFWNYLRTACKNIPQSCINTIDGIENIKSPTAKGRAFIRCALMEKRLSEYLSTAVRQVKLTRKHYLDGAIMLSEDITMICGVLLGLNSIDFSFCLKGQNVDLLGPLAVDYSPYLKFQQSEEGLNSDAEEMKRITSNLQDDENLDNSWKQKYKTLENKYRSMREQKGYLEELLRIREKSLEETNVQKQRLMYSLHSVESEQKKERHELEQVIIELQAQLGNIKSDHQSLQQKYNTLSISHQMALGHVKEIQMTDMAATTVGKGSSDNTNDRQSFTSSLDVNSLRLPPVFQTPDTHSLLSTGSEQIPHPAHEDTHSLVPMAGSLTSQGLKSTGEPSLKEETAPVLKASLQLDPQSQEFERISLHAAGDAANESTAREGDNSGVTSPVDSDINVEVLEDTSPESVSPVMVTSSESDEPVHVTLEEVPLESEHQKEGEGDVSQPSIGADLAVSHDDVTTEEERNDQGKGDLNTSSSSSAEEPEVLQADGTQKRDSDSSESATSWEVTQERDFKATSDDDEPEIPEDDGQVKF